jgi:hypothetical protein
MEMDYCQVTMQLQGAPTPSQTTENRRQVHLSLLPDFHLNLKATSLLGSRAKLQGEFCSQSSRSSSAC